MPSKLKMRTCTVFNGVTLMCLTVVLMFTATRVMPLNALSIISVVGLAVARFGFPSYIVKFFVFFLQCLSYLELHHAQHSQANAEQSDQSFDSRC